MPQLRTAALVTLLACLPLLTAGCGAPRIAVHSLEPGPVFVGATNHWMIVRGEGRRSARERVYMELMNQCRSTGYFSVDDRSEEGIYVRIAGRRVIVEGAEEFLKRDHGGVRIDVLEWNCSRDVEQKQIVDEQGQAHEAEVQVQRGSVLLAVTLFGSSGSAYLAEMEYEGSFATEDLQMSRDEVIERAAQDTVARLVNDITPTQVVVHVQLDGSDPGQKMIIKTARAGNIGHAAEQSRVYVSQNPSNASAAYNLGVFLDAMGNYDEALSMYDKALSLGRKGFYASSRAGCARRLAAMNALTPAPEGRDGDWN